MLDLHTGKRRGFQTNSCYMKFVPIPIQCGIITDPGSLHHECMISTLMYAAKISTPRLREKWDSSLISKQDRYESKETLAFY